MPGLIHVGAWHGLEYIGSPERLLLFEPGPEAFEALTQNTAGNADTEIVNKAIGSVPATATFHLSVPSHSSSLLTPHGPVTADHPVYFDGTAEVEVSTLDDEMRDRDGFDVLRIDTQGYELEVLKGAVETLPSLSRVELELHDPNTYVGAATLNELDAFMESRGWFRAAIDVDGSDGLGDCVYEPCSS